MVMINPINYLRSPHTIDSRRQHNQLYSWPMPTKTITLRDWPSRTAPNRPNWGIAPNHPRWGAAPNRPWWGAAPKRMAPNRWRPIGGAQLTLPLIYNRCHVWRQKTDKLSLCNHLHYFGKRGFKYTDLITPHHKLNLITHIVRAPDPFRVDGARKNNW